MSSSPQVLVLRHILHKLIDKKDILGRTPLIYAAQSGHEALVRLLLERGADVEAKDRGGETALIYAAESGHEAVVRLLKSAGAS